VRSWLGSFVRLFLDTTNSSSVLSVFSWSRRAAHQFMTSAEHCDRRRRTPETLEGEALSSSCVSSANDSECTPCCWMTSVGPTVFGVSDKCQRSYHWPLGHATIDGIVISLMSTGGRRFSSWLCSLDFDLSVHYVTTACVLICDWPVGVVSPLAGSQSANNESIDRYNTRYSS